eukprot:4547208-Prymnesium_polylepis.1
MPSWLIGDAAACCWDLRQRDRHTFALWLGAALAADDIPRPALSATAKLDFERQLCEAADRAHFKAALKQLCGGKKKNTAGTPGHQGPAPQGES